MLGLMAEEALPVPLPLPLPVALTSSSTVHADADADADELLLLSIDRFEMIDPSQIINPISQSHNLTQSVSQSVRELTD